MKAPKKMTAETFITFVQRQRSDMLRMASQLLASADDAEDTVQEVLMKLWAARERFADAGEMGKVAHAAIRNTALNTLRNQKVRKALPLEQQDVAAADNSPDTLMEVRERSTQMHRLITRLPAADRALLKMRNIDQLSYSQIALMLGTTEGAVRQRISRLRQMLITQMKTL